MNYEQKIKELLLLAGEHGASDLHIGVARKPTFRIDGVLVPLDHEPILTPETAQALIYALLTPEQKEKLVMKREVDFSFSLEEKVRFRANVYYQRGYVAAALRLIPWTIKTVEQLGLPTILHEFTKIQQGFFLVVGPAGQGKSSTLAALMDEINHTQAAHIITVEDPVEYLFIQDKSIISQREIGSDALNFHLALRSMLRQDPDVIMIGEMRDRETIETALTAAETGHLVFSTLHTNSAIQTIDRIIDSFSPEQQSQVRSQVSSSLVGVISQRLLPRIQGGLVPAYELMITNTAIRNLIREEKIYQIDLVIETGLQEGMISLNRSLADLVLRGEVSLDTALAYSLNPEELSLFLERR